MSPFEASISFAQRLVLPFSILLLSIFRPFAYFSIICLSLLSQMSSPSMISLAGLAGGLPNSSGTADRCHSPPYPWSNTQNATVLLSTTVVFQLCDSRMTPRKSMTCIPESCAIRLEARTSNRGSFDVDPERRIHFFILGAPTIPTFSILRRLGYERRIGAILGHLRATSFPKQPRELVDLTCFSCPCKTINLVGTWRYRAFNVDCERCMCTQDQGVLTGCINVEFF